MLKNRYITKVINSMLTTRKVNNFFVKQLTKPPKKRVKKKNKKCVQTIWIIAAARCM